VLGVCFFSAAWRKSILQLNTAMADALSSLMIITAVALILPTALYSTFESSMPLDLKDQILAFSRGTAVVLFVLYIAYIYFELGSHKHLFDPPPDESTAQDYGNVTVQQETRQGTRQDTQQGTEQDTQQNVQQDVQQDMQQDTPPPSTLLTSVTVLFCSGAGIMLCSHFLLDSIDETSKVTHISKTFIATILIPIASNAPECATVVGASRRGKIDFAVGVIVSSILQIALCVIPVLVMLGWVIHQPMTLNFDTFQTIMLFLAILLVNHLLQNGKYTYMHGLVLVGL
jgi:Ca2+:H+ antiporter